MQGGNSREDREGEKGEGVRKRRGSEKKECERKGGEENNNERKR